MKLLTTLLVLVLSLLTTALPIGPPSVWSLSVEPSLDEAALPEFPGFSGMIRPSNSTSVSKYEPNDTSTGLHLDGDTCKYVTLSGNGKVGETTLQAKCVDGQGTWWDTSLNLNDCAANEGGFLVFREDGGFDESCRPCVVVDPVDVSGLQLKCKCVNGEMEDQYALLPLGSYANQALAIKPIDGRLTCGKKKGMQTPSYYSSY